MTIIEINKNLKINIDLIYSLEKSTNQYDINEWEKEYNEYIKLFSKDPPELYISNEKSYRPEFGKLNSEEDLSLYTKALDDHIISIIGEKPIYAESYSIILSTGLKININKTIYNTLNKYLDDYCINKKEP